MFKNLLFNALFFGIFYLANSTNASVSSPFFKIENQLDLSQKETNSNLCCANKDENKEPENQKVFTSEQVQKNLTGLNSFYFFKRIFLGKLTKNEIASLGKKKINCWYLELKNKMKEKELADSMHITTKNSIYDLLTLYQKNSVIIGSEILIKPTIERALINQCTVLLQQGSIYAQTLAEEALRFMDLYGDQSESPRYYFVDNYSIYTPSSPSKEWDTELYPTLEKLQNIHLALAKEGVQTPSPITCFCYNEERTAVGVGCASGDTFFINFITKKIIHLEPTNSCNQPIQTIFFDLSEEILFAFGQNGTIQGWHLPTETRILANFISAANCSCIPNKARTNLLITPMRKNADSFTCSLKELSPGDRILFLSLPKKLPFLVPLPLFNRYQKIFEIKEKSLL